MGCLYNCNIEKWRKVSRAGAGILMAEDFDDFEYKYDVFYINNGVESIALKIDDIKEIVF